MGAILNIETTSDVCSVALGNHGQLVDLMEEQNTRDHASKLTVLIQKLLKKNKLSVQELDGVAVSKGPGSYTGLRIGVSTAKGICYAANKPLLAVDTLKMLCRQATDKVKEEQALYCPLIDARRMEVYTVLFSYHLHVIKPVMAEVINAEFLARELAGAKIYFFGSGAEKIKPLISSENAGFIPDIHPSAAHMLALSEEEFLQNNFQDVAYFEPFYLKDFIATTPRKKFL